MKKKTVLILLGILGVLICIALTFLLSHLLNQPEQWWTTLTSFWIIMGCIGSLVGSFFSFLFASI